MLNELEQVLPRPAAEAVYRHYHPGEAEAPAPGRD